jgi:NitT/TauT family transport system permease protein
MSRAKTVNTTTRSTDKQSSPTVPPVIDKSKESPRMPFARIRRSALLWQLVLLVAFLAVWQYLPDIPGVTGVLPWADPFFISSPDRASHSIGDQLFGAQGTSTIWAPMATTLITALIGMAIGIVLGALAGLVCSHWLTLDRIARPYLVILNALPKVALIPVIVLMFRTAADADVVVAFLVVFFVIFYNAYQGGLSVPAEMIANSRLLGASGFDILRRVRLPYVMTWVYAQFPVAVANAITGTVTAELFTGSGGVGTTLITSIDTSNADLTIAVVIILGVIAVALVLLGEYASRRFLRWQ